jgi:hypothetical protein
MKLFELLDSPLFDIKKIKGQNTFGKSVWYGFTLPSNREVKVGFIESGEIPDINSLIDNYVGTDHSDYESITQLIHKEKLYKHNINVQQIGFYTADTNGNDSEEITGLGEASLIFQGVVECIRMNVEESNPDILIFASHETSRHRLYSAITKRMMKENKDWKVLIIKGPAIFADSDVLFLCLNIESLKR